MTWLLVFVIMLLVVFGMSIGVIMGRKPIAGSCGGIANLGIEKECSICGGDRQKCEEANRDESVVPGKLPTTRPNANVRHFAQGVTYARLEVGPSLARRMPSFAPTR